MDANLRPEDISAKRLKKWEFALRAEHRPHCGSPAGRYDEKYYALSLGRELTYNSQAETPSR
jgi:hypothetical protein